MLPHGRILGELGVGANEHSINIFTLVLPYGGIKDSYLAPVLFVQLCFGHTHDFLKRGVVFEEAFFFCGEVLRTNRKCRLR